MADVVTPDDDDVGWPGAVPLPEKLVAGNNQMPSSPNVETECRCCIGHLLQE
jgi:hypothetical protein